MLVNVYAKNMVLRCHVQWTVFVNYLAQSLTSCSKMKYQISSRHVSSQILINFMRLILFYAQRKNAFISLHIFFCKILTNIAGHNLSINKVSLVYVSSCSITLDQ